MIMFYYEEINITLMNIPTTQCHLLLKLHDEVKLSLVALSDPVAVRDTIGGHLDLLDAGHVVKLVHGVVLPPSQQSRVSRKVVLVVVTNVGTCHVLVFHTVQTFSDLTTLDSADIGKHGVRAKVSSDKRITNVKQDKKVFKVTIS